MKALIIITAILLQGCQTLADLGGITTDADRERHHQRYLEHEAEMYAIWAKHGKTPPATNIDLSAIYPTIDTYPQRWIYISVDHD